MVNFVYGSQAKFDALSPKDLSAIYFIVDTQRIYRGETLIASHDVEFVSALPETSNARSGLLYVVTSAEGTTLHVLNSAGDAFVQVGGGEAKEIADGIVTFSKFESGVIATAVDDENASDEKLPTEKAVVDYVSKIKEAIETQMSKDKGELGGLINDLDAELNGYSGAIVNVSAARSDDNTGTVISFTPKEGEVIKVTVADLFLANAEYDNTTHDLTLTVQGGSVFTVPLDDLIPEACSTQDVGLSGDIVTTIAVGNIAKGTTISKDTDLQTLLLQMLSKDSLPTKTDPSVVLSGEDEFKSYEVGTVISALQVTATFGAGSYSQTAAKDQVASGVTPVAGSDGHVWTATCTGQDTQYVDEASTQETFDFNGFTVEDDTEVQITVKANHTKGNTPKSYLGNDSVDGTPTSTKAIAAGSKSDTTAKITGFRYGWYGYKGADNAIADPANISIDEIKALTATKSLPSSINGSKMKQMFFIVPKTWASSLSIKGANPPAPQTVIGPKEIQVGGVGNYDPIAYNLFYVSNTTAASGDDTYTLTWA